MNHKCLTLPFMDISSLHFQTGAITAIIFLAFALIFVDDIAGYVIAFMKKVIDFPRATGTAHLPVEEQEKKEQELHQFLKEGINLYFNLVKFFPHLTHICIL